MKYFEISGSKSEVESCFAGLGIDAISANTIIDYLRKNKEVLNSDEYLNISTEFPSFPPGTIGLMIPRTNYYINIKVTTIVIAALLADIALTQGALSTFLGLCGFSSTALTELSEELGEKCIVRETLARKPKVGSSHILDPLKGECCNNDLSCMFRIDGRCYCSEDDIQKIYEKLTERNMFSRFGEFYKYQW